MIDDGAGSARRRTDNEYSGINQQRWRIFEKNISPSLDSVHAKGGGEIF